MLRLVVLVLALSVGGCADLMTVGYCIIKQNTTQKCN